jgi:beta-glucanase (GH16 family)
MHLARTAFAAALLLVASICARAQNANGFLSLKVPIAPSQLKCAPVDATRPMRNVKLTRSFHDDFDKLDLSTGKWTPHYDGGYDWLVKRTQQGNKEQQIYVDPGYRGQAKHALGLNPFEVSSGILAIVGRRTPPELRQYLYNYEFISGALTTRASFSQIYGYFEMRARIPGGKALWPAFWLLPTDKFNWPPELDVLEVVGGQPDLMVMTTHWKEGGVGPRRASGCRIRLPSATTSFHQFGALWEKERITYYIDRKPVAEIATPPGFDVPMYLLINLAIGGNMVGPADETTPLPARYEIDWVSAYKLDLP